jgi:hypothetical protein
MFYNLWLVPTGGAAGRGVSWEDRMFCGETLWEDRKGWSCDNRCQGALRYGACVQCGTQPGAALASSVLEVAGVAVPSGSTCGKTTQQCEWVNSFIYKIHRVRSIINISVKEQMFGPVAMTCFRSCRLLHRWKLVAAMLLHASGIRPTVWSSYHPCMVIWNCY